MRFVFEGEPLPKPRPRVARGGGVSTPGRYKAYEQGLGWMLREAMRSRAPLTEAIALRASFFRSSLRVVDGDNLLKAVLDAGNGIGWRDDSQVIAVFYRVGVDRGRPRVEVEFGPDDGWLQS